MIGDAINTASRIQSVAQPGTVLVDDVTRAVTERAIAYEDAGAHVVKGKTARVDTWRALRVVAGVGGAGRIDLELPLVGRDQELGARGVAFDTLIESNAGLQLVSVIGEPGPESPGWHGSSRNTPTASRPRSFGTTDRRSASDGARGSHHWPRWCAPARRSSSGEPRPGEQAIESRRWIRDVLALDPNARRARPPGAWTACSASTTVAN